MRLPRALLKLKEYADLQSESAEDSPLTFRPADFNEGDYMPIVDGECCIDPSAIIDPEQA